MNHSARRVDQILTDTPQAATLLARLNAAREAASLIAHACAEIAPGFDPLRPGACDLREHVLRIWLRSSATCVRFRQATPRLLTILRSHGLEVNEIRVGVQLGSVREAGAGAAQKKSSNATAVPGLQINSETELVAQLDFSRKLALTLRETPIGIAAERMARLIETRLARMRESNQTFDKQDGEKNHARADSGKK